MLNSVSPARAAPPSSRRSRQHGLSLVELLVGATIGLFVMGAAVLGITTSLRENRLLLLEARLQQDLRAAMDLITRDTRHAGYWGSAVRGVPTATSSATANPHIAIDLSTMPDRPNRVDSTTPVSATGNAASLITYRWDRNANGDLDANEAYQFRLDSNKIQMQIGSGGWQDVTDPGSMVVTSFSITPRVTWLPLYDKCTTTCNPVSQNCPELAIRTLTFQLSARSLDSSVQRTLRSDVRVRNDALQGSCS
ncbi:PilW family protein [Caldimonas tepidiphila]|uniref:PilW family protein n=1 Tax=Caldimonas tepidiphila TaxID=2315841 RepID=UPI000E5C12D1|nr:prepilin-type N-terminal cleavage/methylation domain-containing protein [Caldimonas tepidiphila]